MYRSYLFQLLISPLYFTHKLMMNRIAAISPSATATPMMRRRINHSICPIIIASLHNQWDNRRRATSRYRLPTMRHYCYWTPSGTARRNNRRQPQHYYHNNASQLLFITQPQPYVLFHENTIIRSPRIIGNHQEQQLRRPSHHPSHTFHNKPNHHSMNRYERFRRVLLRITLSQQDIADGTAAVSSISPLSYQTSGSNSFLHDEATNLLDVGKHTMEVISSNRRSFHRSWKRMKPMIQLILQSCNNAQKGYYKNDAKCISQTSNNISSIADVGCDHGLVALSLACMSWAVSQRRRHANSTERHLEDDFVFDRVTGTDISSMALENGGYVSYKKLIDAIMTQSSGSGKQETNTQLPTLPIEFRVGCGLEPLQRGEADAIVLAGMGHLTMLDVLFGSSEVQGERIHPNSDDADLPPVDRIHAQRIFLQPTNSRPQHMIELYDRMHESRMWELKGETIAYVGGRYYINSYFERMSNKIQRELPEDAQYRFPGHFMVRDTLDHAADGGGGVYESYVKHHIQWLKDDYQRPKYKMEEEDRRWLEFISSAEEYKDRWKSSLSWFSH